MKITESRIREIICGEISSLRHDHSDIISLHEQSPGPLYVWKSIYDIFTDTTALNGMIRADAQKAAGSFRYKDGEAVALGYTYFNRVGVNPFWIDMLDRIIKRRIEMNEELYDIPLQGDKHVPGIPPKFFTQGKISRKRMRNICKDRAKAYYKYWVDLSTLRTNLPFDIDSVDDVARYANPWTTAMIIDLCAVLNPNTGCEPNGFTRSGVLCSGLITWKHNRVMMFTSDDLGDLEGYL